jgi:hypothetical protein
VIPTGFLQDLTAQFRPESAAIQRATETVTGDGTSTSWSTIATVSARLSPRAGSSEGLGADQSMQAVSDWRVSLPVGTDVTVRDRIVIGARTFEITSVGERSYGVEIHAYCKEIV